MVKSLLMKERLLLQLRKVQNALQQYALVTNLSLIFSVKELPLFILQAHACFALHTHSLVSSKKKCYQTPSHQDIEVARAVRSQLSSLLFGTAHVPSQFSHVQLRLTARASAQADPVCSG